MVVITFFSNLYLYNHLGTLYILDRGLNLFEKSSLSSLMVLTIFVAEVPTGVLADKIGRKYSIIIALSCQFIGECIYVFANNYLLFVLCSLVGGIGWAFLSGCSEALIYDSLPDADKETVIKKTMGLMGSSYQSAFFLAPILAGGLIPTYELGQFRLVVALTAFSVLIALLISLTLDEPRGKWQTGRESFLAILRQGLGGLGTNRNLYRIALVTILTATFHGSLVGLYQPHFHDHGISAFWIGIALSAAALLAIFTEKYAFKLEAVFGQNIGFSVAVILPGVLYIILALVTQKVLLIMVFVLTYAALRIRSPLISAYTNRLISSDVRATILSSINMFTSLFVAIIGLGFGWLADRSISYAFLSIGSMIVGFAVVLRVDKIPMMGKPDTE